MFTGIIEDIGTVVSFEPQGRVWELCARTKLNTRFIKIGQSMSVSGVCLTVVRKTKRDLFFQIQEETLRKTSFQELKKGDRVNLERALLANGRLDGHFVLGHVDTVGKVIELSQKGKDWILVVAYPKRIAPYLVACGSIAVEGVSLTLAKLTQRQLEIHLIPHTLKKTNFNYRKKGDPLNLEVDILGKYVFHQIQD